MSGTCRSVGLLRRRRLGEIECFAAAKPRADRQIAPPLQGEVLISASSKAPLSESDVLAPFLWSEVPDDTEVLAPPAQGEVLAYANPQAPLMESDLWAPLLSSDVPTCLYMPTSKHR